MLLPFSFTQASKVVIQVRKQTKQIPRQLSLNHDIRTYSVVRLQPSGTYPTGCFSLLCYATKKQQTALYLSMPTKAKMYK